MCGITGWVHFDKDLRQHDSILKRMIQTLEKRGPDASNVFRSPHVALGHTRLIVVDPAGGVQPMSKQKGGRFYTIIYNGELYNTEDIRKQLMKRGHTFQSHSDTEVLLTSFLEWGEGCVEYLNGIYAFAVWDHKEEKLFIVRDRLGVKPLFYAEKNGGLLFGSEIKAILAHPDVKAEVDQEGIQEIFALGPSHTPGHGVFRGIKELRPAHMLIYDRNGLTVKRYWNVVSKEHTHTLTETIEYVRYLVKDAVIRQLVADVPVCTLLSGGVDSSAISAIVSDYFQKERRGLLHTYSIDYENNSQFFKASTFQPDEDRPWIEKVTENLHVVHHYKTMDNSHLADYLKEAVRARDLPGMADIDSSLLWFFKQIRKDFVVALSGECADEIFGGYPWFYKKELLSNDNFPWMTSVSERQELLHPKWQKKVDTKEYISTKYEETIREVPRLEGENQEEARRREMFYLNMIWFMTTLLERNDRMSMRASVEVRVPYADHRIVEYMWNIPWEMKMLGGREKGLLRKALEGILPQEILYRKKSPYPKTYHPQYVNIVEQLLKKILHDKTSPLLTIISKQKVETLLNKNSASFQKPWFGQLMTRPQVIAYLIQINMWLKMYNVNIVDH